jgi:plasmid stabilization system protein ParE
VNLPLTNWLKLSAGTKLAGPALGGEFFDSVAAALSVIETNPEIGTTLSPDSQTRRVLLTRFPYQVVYRLRPTEIVIVAIAHLKRRPRYWKDR